MATTQSVGRCRTSNPVWRCAMPDYVTLSRLQFALTTLFHILWPVLTISLSLFLVLTEALWLKTDERHGTTMRASGAGCSCSTSAWASSPEPRSSLNSVPTGRSSLASQQNDWEVTIPGMLSVLATGHLRGQVSGLRAVPVEDQPPLLPLIFYGFRVMAGIGFAFFLLMAWSLWRWARGELRPDGIADNRWLLRAWVAAVPLGYIAVDAGWIVREVGRQPWIIYGLLRTQDGASALPSATVAYTTIGYLIIYTALLVAFILFALRIISRGPDFMVQVPTRSAKRQDVEGRRAGVRRA